MVKVFKTNANDKIELTLEELEKLLKEAEEEGRNSIVRTTPAPSITYSPYPNQLPITITNGPLCGDSLPIWNSTTASNSTDDNTATIHAANQASWCPIEGAENAR